MLDSLGEVNNRFGAKIHGYCLMPNHFHWLIPQEEIPLSTNGFTGKRSWDYLEPSPTAS